MRVLTSANNAARKSKQTREKLRFLGASAPGLKCRITSFSSRHWGCAASTDRSGKDAQPSKSTSADISFQGDKTLIVSAYEFRMNPQIAIQWIEQVLQGSTTGTVEIEIKRPVIYTASESHGPACDDFQEPKSRFVGAGMDDGYYEEITDAERNGW